jgi:BNR repeat-containing family member
MDLSRTALLWRLLLSVACGWVHTEAFAAAPAGPALLSEHGSERSTTGPGNNIVTCTGKTHVVWQESDAKGYWSHIGTLDHATGKWSASVRLGRGKDNHARPCIAVDSHGYLHVVIGGHNSVMNYYRSKRPNDASAWERPEPVDIGTYPMLVCGAEDTLVLGARQDTGVRGVNLFVKRVGGTWEKRERVFQRKASNTGYAGYNVALAWGPDGRQLHLSADVYESGPKVIQRGAYQALVYMVSDDLGVTWRRSDGTPIPSGAAPDKLDVLAEFTARPKDGQPPVILRNGGVAVDNKGQAFIYFIHVRDGVPRARLVSSDERGGWRELPLHEAFQRRWSAFRPAGARGSLTMTTDQALHVLFLLDPRQSPATEQEDAGFGMGLLTTHDRGATFEARELFAPDPSAKAGQASLERQTGHNDLRGRLPGVLWSDGLHRYPAPGEVIHRKVYWVQPR